MQMKSCHFQEAIAEFPGKSTRRIERRQKPLRKASFVACKVFLRPRLRLDHPLFPARVPLGNGLWFHSVCVKSID